MRLVRFVVFSAALFSWACSKTPDNEIAASGTIEATEVTISAKIGGELFRLFVDEGTGVRVNDTLAIVDPTDYTIQLKQARANYEAAKAQNAQAKASLKNAQEDLRRMEELWSTKAVTQKQFDDTQTRYTVAQQTMVASHAHRDLALAQLEGARKKLSDCSITSPVSGTVTKLFIERGELVGQGMALLRIANLTEMDFMIYVSATELPKITLGQDAAVKVDAFEDREFHGTVVYISPVAEFTPKNIQTKEERTKLVFGVKIRVANPDGVLKAGIPADVILKIGPK